MNNEDILKYVDHTVLGVDAKWEDIKSACNEALEYGVASICIPPCYVKQAREYAGNDLKICTVVGFPNGYTTSLAKAFETLDTIEDGADEIDMVINISYLKNRRFDDILAEIIAVRRVSEGKILKVIIETCLLTDEEKIKMCEIVALAKADYIKTSTGFSHGGATDHDIELFAQYIKDNDLGGVMNIKAAGGISSLDDANRFIKMGANRLGSSRIISLIKGEASTGY